MNKKMIIAISVVILITTIFTIPNILNINNKRIDDINIEYQNEYKNNTIEKEQEKSINKTNNIENNSTNEILFIPKKEQIAYINNNSNPYLNTFITPDKKTKDEPIINIDNKNYATYNGRLHLDKTKLVNEKGEEFRLTGIGLQTNYETNKHLFSNDTLLSLKKWGVNLLRVFVDGNKRYSNHYHYINNEETYLNNMYEAIDNAIYNDMYVIINWNPSDNDPLLKDATNLFLKITNKYKNDPHIIYELWNEPSNNITCSKILDYINTIIPIIRNESPDSIILVPHSNKCSDIKGYLASNINYSNIMYTYHFYPNSISANIFENISNDIESDIPIFVTEWAAGSYEVLEDTIMESYASSFNSLLTKYNISYSYFGIGQSTYAFSLFNKNKWDSSLPNEILNNNAKFFKKILSNDSKYNSYLMIENNGSSANDGKYYRSLEWKDKIISIEFKKKLELPNNTKIKWDLSQAQDNSVIGYLEETNEIDKYKLIIAANGNVTAPNNSNYLFAHLTNLKEINFNNFDTEYIKRISGLFTGDSSLENLDLSSFKTDNIVEMWSTFKGCSSLKTINFDGWHPNIVGESNMFQGCSSIEYLDLSGFNVDKVTSFSKTFSGLTSLKTLNISTWNPIEVIDVNNMFNNMFNVELVDMSLFDFESNTNLTGILNNVGTKSNNTIFKIKNNNIKETLDTITQNNININYIYPYNEIENGTIASILWSFNPLTSTLEIDGNGDIPNFTSDNPSPWYKYKEYVKNIIIGENITRLGDYAFYNFTDVRNIYINSIALEDLSYNKKVDNNKGTNYTFYNFGTRCGATLTFGKNVTKIPAMLMQPEDYNPPLNINNVVFEGNNITTIGQYGLANYNGNILVIPDGVSKINPLSLGYGKETKLIILPESLTLISYYSINKNEKLEKIVFASSIDSIKEHAIARNKNLKTLVIPHIDNPNIVYKNTFESIYDHNIVIYGDASTKSWVNNMKNISGQTNLIYKNINEYKSAITSNTNINEKISYNESYTFNTEGKVKAYYKYIDSNGNTYLSSQIDLEKNNNTYTINNIKNDIYIEID